MKFKIMDYNGYDPLLDNVTYDEKEFTSLDELLDFVRENSCIELYVDVDDINSFTINTF